MCLKLDDGAVLFSNRDMLRLRKSSSGALGAQGWATHAPEWSGTALEIGDSGSIADHRNDPLASGEEHGRDGN